MMKQTPLYLACILLVLAPLTVQAGRGPADDESNVDDPRVQHRSYVFPPTGETLPYALFVPSTYQPGRPAPLLVSLHGLGRSYDWLMRYHGLLDEAEANGYLVVTPLGYIRRGWYGSRSTPDPDDGIFSEQDVMEVLRLVRSEFNVDPDRIYLWGHSMGGAGTYHIASKNPALFAGLAVVAPAPEPDAPTDPLESIRHLPILVLQGDQDELVDVSLTRRWVARMRALGMQHVYVEIPGADHTDFIAQDRENMQRVIDFFNIVRKSY